MSHYAWLFAIVTVVCGFLGLGLAAVISVLEEDDERFYGNGKETGFKDKQE